MATAHPRSRKCRDGGGGEVPKCMVIDGAQLSAAPCVPGAMTSNGRGPSPVHGAVGSSTEPLTTSGPPWASVDA